MPVTGASAGTGGLPQPVLATARLSLRPIAAGDAAAVFRLAGDADVARWSHAIPHPLPMPAVEGFIRQSIIDRAKGEAVTYAVIRDGDGAFLGGLTLRLTGPHGADLGFWFGRPFWNQGYATEAVRAVLRYAFADLGRHEVIALCHPDNAASLKVQAKCGMVPLGRITHPDDPSLEVLVSRARAAVELADPTTLLLVVAVALIDADGRVLLAERPAGKPLAGLWEFPGGKLRDGEAPERALIRELKEELGIDVTASCLAPLTFASHRYADQHLLMPLYVCRVWDGVPAPLEGQKLAWVAPAELDRYKMPPADLPLIPMLRELLRG